MILFKKRITDEPVISKRIKRRRVFTVISLVFLVAFSGILVTSKYFNSLTKAATVVVNGTSTIKQSDTIGANDYVVNGTLVVDGEHTFNSITINSGGVLTTSDYNLYGVDVPYVKESIYGDDLFQASDQKYMFIMRGFINTGSNHDRKYAAVSGIPSSSPTHPNGTKPDDSLLIDFYEAVSDPTYSNVDWVSGTLAGYAYGAHNGTSYDVFTDSTSSAGSPFIPFEAIYYNASSENHFGIASCINALACTSTSHQYYLTAIRQSTSFQSTASNPEMKTYIAWQSAKSSLLDAMNETYSGSRRYNSYDGIKDYTSSLKTAGYTDTYFYRADNFDFAYDPKVLLSPRTDILKNTELVVLTKQYEYYSNGIRLRSHFNPDYSRNSPLASRMDDAIANNWYGFPVMSSSLVMTMRENNMKVPTKITVINGITVNSGGKINVSGKGFAPSVQQFGAGAGAGNNSNTGASHSGQGGYRITSGACDTSNPPAPAYDNSYSSTPELPGSSGYWSRGQMKEPYYGYSGGYIYISAKTINLAQNSMVLANGVGGNQNNPFPGSSGGGIILKDADSNSKYLGAILASGGTVWDSSSTSEHPPSGGGGYIYIESQSNTDTLVDRMWKTRTTTFVSTDEEYDPTTAQLISRYGTANPIVAFGGLRDSSNANCPGVLGQNGIINIFRGNSLISLKKTVNPLNVNPGEEVTVTITNDRVQGTYSLEDEVLNDGNGKYFNWVSWVGSRPTGCSDPNVSHKIICTGINLSSISYKLSAPLD